MERNYDELVKDLRENHDKYFARDMEAADVIEGLSVVVRVQKAALEKFPRWIPVTEQLPEPYTWALVSAENYGVAVNAFYDGAQWKDDILNVLIVTHWMPLPEPPKEE